jgi:Xaa-Pro aminopeptidase
MLQPEHCRTRQRRLLEVMASKTSTPSSSACRIHVYYFTGYRPFWLHEAAFMLRADGEATLVCGKDPDGRWRRTRADVRVQLARHAAARPGGPGRGGLDDLRDSDVIGLDASPVGSQVAIRYAHAKEFDEHLWALRRRKDPDELALMRKAITCTEAMYRRAREIIEPGVAELTVYNELHKVAVDVAGEPLSPAYLGNDYACAAPGGPPRAGHVAQAGRAVHPRPRPGVPRLFLRQRPHLLRRPQADRRPDDRLEDRHRRLPDHRAHGQARRPLPRPVRRHRRHYRERTGNGFPHHLGHGVGLQPHEFPHLNPKWDEVLMEGEVFTCEPGMYADELRAGMRIENPIPGDGERGGEPNPISLGFDRMIGSRRARV